MKLLLLGGPKFLGRAVADAALERGHELTFFNRGTTNSELYRVTYAGAEKLRGDRDGDLTALAGRAWDAVVDTSGYVPQVVRASAETLAGSGLYCFVSSISVYADYSVPVDEGSPTAELGDAPIDALTPDFSNYGALKALCEAAVTETFGGGALNVRPGLIVGPHDPTGRFTYWPNRIARGGEVLAVAPADRRTQFVDVRDLGEWLVTLCERGAAGTFNATNAGVTWAELLAVSSDVTGSAAEITWVDEDFLVANEVGEWMELPLWLAGPAMAYADRVDVSRAVAEGLRFRPLEDTIRATLELASVTDGVGLASEREAALLEKWNGR